MMAFITRCLKKLALRRRAYVLLLICWCAAAGLARAADGEDAKSVPAQTPPVLSVERADNALWLSARFAFELPAVVEGALLKGVPIYFLTEVDVLRERWYWFSRKVATVQRRARLDYHPLTRRWRLSVGAADAAASAQGLTLSQNFDTLDDAMAAVRRVAHWRIADLAGLEAGAKHLLQFRFQLDTSELPRPLQIGTLGQSDWVISLSAAQRLEPEPAK